MSERLLRQHTAANVADVEDVVRNTLLGELRTARVSLQLSQTEVAERAGLSRMTVQRAEGENADVSLATFTKLALAVNLTPRLVAASAVANGDPDQYRPPAGDIVHRGLAHNRTRHSLTDRDRQRERELSKRWEAANSANPVLPPLLESLVPGHSQEVASAVATVVQHLGSEVGFGFLRNALEAVGYEIVDTASRQRVR